ncbi:inositol monophosphatase family protein [Microbacterium marinilacus]|uniref:inositol-phosphate phosphatase n=1 Tax=Microbacterium marinilacus TaxID=415209 RepID=A0ABP7B7I4_9MICO|nr:inositol monophosphatase family protein [Microbacterium marinilacus]MBY0687548.1 histidinol phosphatase [Microbacterium marinilacus]
MNPAAPTSPVSQGDLGADLRLALDLADAADAQTLPRFDAADLDVSRKADSTHVTDSDLAAERAVRRLLAERRPEDGVLGEEYGSDDAAGSADASSRRWIIDPIDGTANFLRGVPVWGTMIGLQIDGTMRLGVVSSPALGRRWWGAEGLGAWTSAPGGEPRPIRVSDVATLDDASVSFQSIAQWDGAGRLDALVALTRRVWRDRAYGDIWSYMLLAEGRLEMVGEFDVKEYDLAAAAAIVTAAGGRFSSFDGTPTIAAGSAVATNGVLHDAILDVLHSPASPDTGPR